MYAREIDVVDAPATPYSQAELAHCSHRQVLMNVGIVDQRRAKQERFEGAQPCERDGFLLGYLVAMRDANSVSRGKSHVFRHAPHHGENRMRMNVYKTGSYNFAIRVDLVDICIGFHRNVDVASDVSDSIVLDSNKSISDNWLPDISR